MGEQVWWDGQPPRPPAHHGELAKFSKIFQAEGFSRFSKIWPLLCPVLTGWSVVCLLSLSVSRNKPLVLIQLLPSSFVASFLRVRGHNTGQINKTLTDNFVLGFLTLKVKDISITDQQQLLPHWPVRLSTQPNPWACVFYRPPSPSGMFHLAFYDRLISKTCLQTSDEN